MDYSVKELIYENKLSNEDDIKGFVLEGEANISFQDGSMELKNALSADLGQKSNFVLWCDKDFPDDIEITWDFSPIKEPGLCIMFFSAKGLNGESIFDEGLAKRTGEYNMYHSGDINCFHVSYYRRMWESERCFHTCNLRKSKGFLLVAQGADPLPDVPDSKGYYAMKIVKSGRYVDFYIDDLKIFSYFDELEPELRDGKIGFRQMAPFVGRYKNLKVSRIEKTII